MLNFGRWFSAAPAAALPRDVHRSVLSCHRLLTARGEVSGALIASEVLSSYRSMDNAARCAFLDALAGEFSPSATSSFEAAEAYRADPSPRNLIVLQEAVRAPREELFRRLNVAPGATQVLVDLRGHLLEGLAEKPEWEPASEDLRRLFTSWFNSGFLALRRIDWSSAATLLEKLIRYEAVHPIEGFPGLRRRLGADRRCYAFFHPAMADEPIVFVEVALVRGMSASVRPLIDPLEPVSDPATADCAMFYSITNCQVGLRGVPFGSFLIKQVVETLKLELPKLRRFATLSPVPGFAEWVKVQPIFQRFAPRVQQNLQQRGWFEDPVVAAEMEPVLAPLCAHYLVRVKKRKEPADPVARFHLRNGARLERVNWLGDTSETGLNSSFGIMVNYIYDLDDIERNHERYADGYKIAVSPRVEGLVRNIRSLPRGAPQPEVA